ncbi:DUF5325 family protein [Oceanobacillus luteolus]|uniref:DUF5325 family protein n=1 Tax=Oceanobacillus luteolus TaxID=1274358 RepID=A0ABW4HS89_9BACI|nr:DUF5325 family protein [Oceanobacillus luteolus]MCM3739892.1 DUF5325 family protein [Oceanobacillus luteolus]
MNMKEINWPLFLLALLVVAMFFGVGFAIALRNIWLIILFLLLGFALMGYGISLKRKRK